MSDGKLKADWAHTSSIMAMLANINRDTKKRSKPYVPADFDPTQQKKVQMVSMGELKSHLIRAGWIK